jgi:hypothetical protein
MAAKDGKRGDCDGREEVKWADPRWNPFTGGEHAEKIQSCALLCRTNDRAAAQASDKEGRIRPGIS